MSGIHTLDVKVVRLADKKPVGDKLPGQGT